MVRGALWVTGYHHGRTPNVFHKMTMYLSVPSTIFLALWNPFREHRWWTGYPGCAVQLTLRRDPGLWNVTPLA